MTRQPHSVAIVHVTVLLLLSFVAASAVIHWWPAGAGTPWEAARLVAVLTLLWSVGATMLHRRDVLMGTDHNGWALARLARIVALLLGVVVAVTHAVVVAVRLIYVVIDLVHGYPASDPLTLGFSVGGLWNVSLLLVACAIALASTRIRQLATCQLWITLLAVTWVCLLPPVLRRGPSGAYERTGSTLLLLVGLAVVLALAVPLARWVPPRETMRPRESHGGRSPWHQDGFTSSVGAVSLCLILLISYHLAVPVATKPGGFRGCALIVTGSAALGALACLLLIRRILNPHLVGTVMGLTSLTLCGFATGVIPATPTTLAERYPMMFNAMMVGLGVATLLWTWMTCIWHQQYERFERIRREAHSRADRPTGGTSVFRRLIHYARRFAFMNAAMALVLGWAMAIWPRWPNVAAMDDSLGRVTAGSAANLFLLLVMLWCSRRLRSPSFHVLTVLCVISMAGFVVIRMLPFTPRFG